jgi:hypothetical protein
MPSIIEKVRMIVVKYNRRIKLILTIILIFTVIFLIYISLEKLKQDLSKGENLTDLRLAITRNLLDSCEVGLSRYRNVNGHLPTMQGKYFLDSIKDYIQLKPIRVYIYYDSTVTGGQTKTFEISVNPQEHFNLFLGIGRPEQTIIYRYISKNEYMLYSVGENWKDEGGTNDDIAKNYLK